MAERVGFEPTIPFQVYTLSKRAPSTTRPSLRYIMCKTMTKSGPQVLNFHNESI